MKAVWTLSVGAMVAALGLAVPASAQMSLADMLGGGGPEGKELEALIEAAQEHPLGSEENPVRVYMPYGQRAYLSRLRCEDGEAPEYSRIGSFAVGPFGRIVDGYEVVCEGSEPAKTTIVLDMYHEGYEETEAVPGYTIAEPG